MQSMLDSGPPLSPSAFFTLDSANSMDTSAMGDDGVDLFRYYMDLQAFQGKEQPSTDPSSSTTNNGSNTADGMMATMNSPYNAFFNPALYTNSLSPSSISPPSAAPSQPIPSTISQHTPQEQESTPSLFPFAEASTTTTSYNTINPATLSNAPSYPSFDHLAGSENPQPIDPHLLMTGADLPAVSVKQEDVDTLPTFHFNQPSLSLNASTAAPLSHSTSANTSARRSASATIDDSMTGIDGLSDDSDSDASEDNDEDEIPAPRKRSSATTAANNKKRTTARKSSSSGTKRTSAASAQSKKESSILHSQQPHPHALVPVPEWEDRLSKAEYDKLSSKEKRQMRNKISARNFRHRRKAHIDTLEALVADKESVIAVLSEEVGTLRTENKGLRADIEVLKKNWESIAAKIGASTSQQVPTQHHHHLTPDEDDLYGAPGSLPALSPAASSSAESTNGDHLSELSFEQARGMANSQAQTQASQARPSTSSSTSTNAKRVTRSAIQRPNLRKDLGPSGTSFNAFGMGGNRSMNVHTTLIPELNFNFPIPPTSVFGDSPPTSTSTLPALTDAASASSGRTSPTIPSMSTTTGSIADMLAGKRERDANANTRLNMNPALNGLSQEQINNLREQFFNANSGMISTPQSSEDLISNVSGKISRHSTNLDPLQNSFFDTNPFISLRQDHLQDYRAQLYAKLANNVAGIHQAQQSQTSTQSNKGNQQQQGMNGLRPAFFANQPITNSKQLQDAEEVAKIASIAQRTLFDKLSTAFWDAFAGNNTSPVKSIVPNDAARKNSNKKSSGDNGQQVVDLLAGRSRLQIVRNEKEEEVVDALVKQVDNLALKK